MASKGYFVIADITGYTAFLSQTELDHAEAILNTLFNTLLGTLQPPLIVSNFQGDAILSYAPEGSFIQSQTLIEALENTYFAFTDIRDRMQYNTTCPCKACCNIRNLDLKLFVHYGSYLLQQMGSRQELMGPDVILAHRMMKNSVKEQIGVTAYLLITEAAAAIIQLGDLQDEMKPYEMTFEHLGEVKMLVHDLRAMAERKRKEQIILIEPEQAHLVFEEDLPVTPALAWDYITKPDLKRQWVQLVSITRIDKLGGRVRQGAEFHCAHSKGDIFDAIVDWRPFDYYTTDNIGLFEEKVRMTFRLKPSETGCRFTWLWCFIDEKRAQAEPIYRKANQSCGKILRQLIEADLTAGITTGIGAGLGNTELI